MVTSDGVAFRVWAPHAQWVRVAGTFNGWDSSSHPLSSEGNGYWSADVAEAAVGDEYRYILGDLNHWRVDPRALDVGHSNGNGIIVDSHYDWQVNDFQMPSWDQFVIYEMHLGTFLRKPVSDEEIFEELCCEIEYLKSLGINAVQIMPVSEFPGDHSWGYNPAHIFAVESHYGGPNALKKFIDHAHSLGIAVFLDVVYNHFGPNDLIHSLWQFDGWYQNDMGGIYFYNDWRAFTEWGAKNRPDYGRPEVRQFIRDNVLMWLEDFRVDGLRFDMTCWIRNVYAWDHVALDDPTNLGGWGWNLLRWINDEVNHRQPWKITIAEDMRQNAAVTRSTSHGGAGFDSQWDDQYHHKLRHAMVTPSDHDRNMDDVAAAITRRYSGDAFQRVIYTESHDEVGDPYGRPHGKQRVPEQIHPGQADGWYAQKRSTLGAAITFTSPGIPMIFQGQEMLEWQQFDGKHRLDWNRVRNFSGIVQLYRDLIKLRRNVSNCTRGLSGHHTNLFHVNHDANVIAWHRWHNGGAGDDVVIVINFSNQAFPWYRIGFPREGVWKVRFNSDWSGYSDLFENHYSDVVNASADPMHGLRYSGEVSIGRYSAIILSQ